MLLMLRGVPTLSRCPVIAHPPPTHTHRRAIAVHIFYERRFVKAACARNARRPLEARALVTFRPFPQPAAAHRSSPPPRRHAPCHRGPCGGPLLPRRSRSRRGPAAIAGARRQRRARARRMGHLGGLQRRPCGPRRGDHRPRPLRCQRSRPPGLRGPWPERDGWVRREARLHAAAPGPPPWPLLRRNRARLAVR
jgi:hypothetical protein